MCDFRRVYPIKRILRQFFLLTFTKRDYMIAGATTIRTEYIYRGASHQNDDLHKVRFVIYRRKYS